MDSVSWAKANNVALVGTWHSNYCDYVKFYSAAWWLVPVLRRYIQQFYGAIPTTYVPTEFMRQKLTVEGYDKFTDMQVWGRGIDLERFNPVTRRSEAFRRRHGFRPQDLVLIWVGRLVPEKRPDIWREVYTRLAAEGLPVKGLVVGVGPCQQLLEGLDGVSVVGWLSGLDLAEAYASADILLFPSDVETFGNVTLEALGSGIPAVVEEKCSAHLVTDGVEGFAVHQGIADPNDKAAYEACVRRYLEKTRLLVVDPDLRTACGQAALKKAGEYSNRAVQQRMIDNYHNAYATQVAPLLSAESDPNDKALHRSRRQACLAFCLRICLWWRFSSSNGWRRVRESLAHHFFAVLARVIIFVLWLLLGFPRVTSTNLNETNIRTSERAIEV